MDIDSNDMQRVAEAQISADVFLTCLSHALSTETQEVMGLLLGDYTLVSPNFSGTDCEENVVVGWLRRLF